MVNLNAISININILRTLFIVFTTQIAFYRIINDKKHFTFNKLLSYICLIAIVPFIENINNEINSFISTVVLTFLLTCIFSRFVKISIGNTLLLTMISLAFNYSIYFISVIIAFFINKALVIIQNDNINFILIVFIHTIILVSILKLKRFKNGITTLQKNLSNRYMEMIILNISVGILFMGVIYSNKEILSIMNTMYIFLIFSIMMFITIQKSLQLYYKQKLLAQELENTKKELSTKTKEVEDLEAENIEISKKAHTLDHKQKSLAKKIDEMMMSTEISKEEAAEVRDRLNKIGKELYKEKTIAELAKTEIPEIDDMLTYMQSECSANKIDFELQLKGNIYYMINNLITKEDLETLLADHIKNAIIAINHTDNINRSILVRLGEIDGTYGLYIYDSGIEFTKETLENLGKKPSTTHADEGGTGMGFMNTFDTLRKWKASLTIEEFNEPNKDNYTKAIIIRFDNKNEFKIKSYRYNKTRKWGKKELWILLLMWKITN